MFRMFLIVVIGFGCLHTASADDGPEQFALAMTPAGEPRPALRLSLWRTPRERSPGNGATYYYRAMILAQQSRETLLKEFPAERVEKWTTVPLAEFPTEEVAKYLQHHQSVFEQLETATAREHCYWDLRLDQLRGSKVVEFLLPDFQNMRDLSRLVAYKARYQVAQKDYDGAIATLRMGYQMARDSAEPPLLINALIGIAISAQMNAVALDLIAAEGSPNLYWALKQLPRPLIDIRPALQYELSMPFQMFPFLADAETAERTPQDWQRLTQETLQTLNSLTMGTPAPWQDWQVRFGGTALMLKAYPAAKKQLVEDGLAAEAVEKMPVAQVVSIQAARNYRYTYEEVFKWTLLPYPEGSAHLRKTLDRLKEEGYLGQPLSEKEVFPIASLLMPAIDNVLLASARGDRRLAAIETIEAVRLQAAKDGKLPSSLTDLAVAPANRNPFTGQLFDYRIEDSRAILSENAPGVDKVRAHNRDYFIELTKPVK